MDLGAFVRGLPKAELHLHIEGSLEPQLMFKLAERHSLNLKYASVEALGKAYQFDNLQSFRDIYYAGASVRRDAEHLHALTAAYMKRAHADGVVHAEIFCDPQTHTARGVPMRAVLEGIAGALEEAAAPPARGVPVGAGRRRLRRGPGGARSAPRLGLAPHRLLPPAPAGGRCRLN